MRVYKKLIYEIFKMCDHSQQLFNFNVEDIVNNKTILQLRVETELLYLHYKLGYKISLLQPRIWYECEQICRQ
jgi:hypothetical protein